MAWSGNFSDFDVIKSNQQGNGESRHRDTRSHLKSRDSFQTMSIIHRNGNNSNVTKLADINPSIPHPTVVGVVLSKEGPRSILSKKNPGSERHLFNFVIRDSPTCFVNVTYWGQEHFINDTVRRICIGDIVQLSNVQVHLNQQDGYDEKFKPATPVGFNLTMSENHSSISSYTGPDTENYRSLQHIPTKASNDYYTLEDVNANGQNLHGEHINLLAAVKMIGKPKDITTKYGKQTCRCELKLLDETCASFPLVLWNSEMIDFTRTWQPLDTILFAADVKITFDNFRSCMMATADSKSIFTVNPDTLEASSLYQYAHSQHFDTEVGGKFEEKSLENITDRFTISQITKKKKEIMTGEWKPSIYGFVNSFITHFDIDSDNCRVLRFKCLACLQAVTGEFDFICNNPECSQGALNIFVPTAGTTQHSVEYSVMMSLSDHTGTVDMCHLDDTVAEKLIGIRAEEFHLASVDKKTNLKWKVLLEKFRVYFKMSCGGDDYSKVFFKMLSCEKM